MKILTKLTFMFLAIILLVTTTVSYSLPSGIQPGTLPPILLQSILIMAAGSMAVLGVFVVRNILQPLKKLGDAGKQIAKGNYTSEVFSGKINTERIMKSDELSQLVLAFEVMRRRVLYLDSNLNRLTKEKTLDLERVNDELVEKDKALQRTNARLLGQSEELKNTNDGLSAKNRELSEAYSKLQTLDKMKSDFILIAAHELRTPIQPILGFVELAEKGSINIEEAMKVIGSEARRLASLSTDILDVGKIDSGTFTYDMKPLGIMQLINGLSASSSKFVTQDGIVTISTDFDNDVKILGDKNRLIQALENIVNNAIKFGKDGTIAIETRNDYDEGLVEIKIVDGGPGIPSEILPVLFNKFVTKTEANQRGTGLGLFITKAIIEAHKGKIRAENNSEIGGRGATFTISLPMCDPNIQTRTNLSRRFGLPYLANELRP